MIKFIFQILYFLLRNVSFPYKECRPSKYRLDAEIISEIKEQCCHLDLDRCGVLEKAFDVKIPGLVKRRV